MQNLLRNAAFVLLLGVILAYAAAIVAIVATVFVAAIALDAVFAGWTRSRARRLNRVDLLDAPDLARR